MTSFFYKLGERIGVERLSETAARFGIGQRLGIDLPGEEQGNLPTDAWKRKYIGEQWYLGDTYHYGIGQGYLLTTPLQVNMFTSAFANGGILYKPTFLQKKEEILSRDLVTSEALSLIREGMIESCSEGGVAWPLFEFKVKNEKLKVDGKNILQGEDKTASSAALLASEAATLASAGHHASRKITVGCKTGTAQHGGEDTLPHAWITLFAPAYDPEIIVTVLVESAGEGSTVAGPIAKEILTEWFTRK